MSWRETQETLEQFGSCWEGLEDPRTSNATLYDFHELLIIALCSVLCGGQGPTDMAIFAEERQSYLRGFLSLKHGVPKHDAFSRLSRALDADQFRAAFQRFMAQFSEQVQGVVAVDGKVLRRSFDRASGKSPLHMVSAWGSEQRLVLAQVATDAKSNEITAVPKLLRMLTGLHLRQAVLGDLAAVLAGMDARVNPRPARDCRSLAPCRVQAVLDVALAAAGSGGQKMHQQGIA